MALEKLQNILVTGGAGYIGSAITQELCERNCSVFVIDDLSKGEQKYIHKKAIFYKIDLNQKNELEQFFKEHRIDCVIHCAAKKAVGESEEIPGIYFDNNISGTINLLNSMHNHRCKKIIFSSSAIVYKTKKDGIYTETDELFSHNTYGFTKIICEKLIKEFSRTTNLQYIFLRYFNVAGDIGLSYKEKQSQNIFPVLAECIKNNKAFLIFGNDYETQDGTGVRDYIHIKDLVNAHISAMDYGGNETFNLGRKHGVSVFQIIKEFEKQLKRTIKFQFANRRKGDVATLIANAEKAEKCLNWATNKRLDSMVSGFIKTYDLK